MDVDPHAAEALAIWNVLGEYSWLWFVERIERFAIGGDDAEVRRIKYVAAHVQQLST